MAGDVVPLCARRLASLPVARQAEVLGTLATDVAAEENKRKGRGEGVRTGRRGHRKRGLGNRVQPASVRPATLSNAIHPVPREKKDVLIAEVHVERLWVGCDLVAVLPEARVGLDPRLVLGREQDTLAEVDRAVRRGRHQS